MRAPSVALVPATDGALVQAIRTGGPLAAAPVCAILRPGIESTLLRVLRGRPQEFEDLLQITYERVIRTVAEGNFEGRSQLKTWAGAIAAHVATDYLRRKSYEARLFEGLGADSIDPPLPTRTPEGQLEARSEMRKAFGVLSRMKPRYARVLVLHDVFGHSVPQVAEHLGLNTNAARSTLRRARQEFVRRCSSTVRPCDQGAGGSALRL